MDSRKVILLAGALIVAALTAFFARSLMMGSATPRAAALGMPAPVPVDGPEVLVATRALPVGTILDATALQFKPWPKELVDNAYYLKASTNLQSLTGTVVRNAITAGQPVTQGALVKPGDRGFLAAALGPGMRAVTVPVDVKSAVAGFVFPGDRVDVLLTQSVAGGGDGPPLKESETIVRNIRVLATDQRTDNTVGEDGKTVVKTFSTVTVEATPRIAEQIAVAQTLGALSLSLRPLADTSQQLEEAIASGGVKAPGDAKGEKALLTKVAAEPTSGNPSFATGADVSHFQRRTVPGTASATPPPPPPSGPVVHVAHGSSVDDVTFYTRAPAAGLVGGAPAAAPAPNAAPAAPANLAIPVGGKN